MKGRDLLGMSSRRLFDHTVLFAFVLLVVALALSTPYFFTSRNLFNILLQGSPLVILALGELLVVLVAGIDLSVGSMVGLSGALAGYLTMSVGLPWELSLVLTLVACGSLGVIQGIFINFFNVTDFVATLAGLSILRGLTLVITQGYPINNLPDAFNFIGQGFLGDIPFPVILTAVILIVIGYWLSQTVSGIHIYGIGGGRVAAHRAGLRVAWTRTLLYGLSGLLAAIAGFIVAARLGSAEPSAGSGYELTAIAAVVIGGASLFGGRGTAWSTALGALIIATILNGMTLLNVPPFYTEMVQGVVILVAVLLENLRRQRA